MENLPEFLKLIERYETITIEEIKAANMNLDKLTRNKGKCTLCLPLYEEDILYCETCTYPEFNIYGSFQCITGVNYETFYGMGEAITPKQLLTAYRNRAKHMRSVLKKLNIEMP